MWFWIFMFVCDLLIPFVMFFSGWMMYKHPPKEINGIIGYRTRMSMKNEQTWKFAHEYCGKLWMKLGCIMLLPSIICHFPIIRSNDGVIGTVGGILITIQCVILVISIFPVERELKKRFDANGNPK